MTVDETVVRTRVAEAEALLASLAVPGTPDHDALSVLADAPARASSGATEELVAGLEALERQARAALVVGLHVARPGGPETHWMAVTAPDWQRYVRWLLATHQGLAAAVAAVPDAERPAVLRLWERTEDGCTAARRVWASVSGTPSEDGTRALVPGTTPLQTVVVDGRVHVDVEQLATALHERAAAFAAAARTAAESGDELGALVSEVLAAELTSRADALVVAGMEQ